MPHRPKTQVPPAAARRRRVSEDIVRQIQDRISRGELKPGERLPPERALAQTLGASRGTMREALRALEQAGFIEARHGGGTFVAATLPGAVTVPLVQFLERQRQTLLDLFEARRSFEPRLAYLAAERATRDDVDRLRQAIDRQAAEIRGGEIEAASRADRVFHQAIADATGNRTLSMLHHYLSDLVADSRRDAAESLTRREQALRDHREIFDAISRGDGPAASAAMLHHLKNVEAYLVEDLQAYRGAVGGLAGEVA